MKNGRARPSRATPWLVGAAIWAMTGWFFPFFPDLGSPNELTRLYLTRAVVDDASFSIDGPVERYGKITDMALRDGRLYSDKAPGTGLLGVPAYFVLKVLAGWDAEEVTNPGLLRALRFLLVGFPTGLIAVFLFGLLVRLGLSRERSLILQWAYGLGTIAFPYGSLLYGHQLCALFLVLSLAGIERNRRAPAAWLPLCTGACLAASLSIEYTSLLLVAPLGAAAIISAPRRIHDTILGMTGALLPLGVLAVYHSVCFGAPWSTGYAHLAHGHYAAVHAQGFMGLVTPSFERLGAILVSPGRGLWFYSPWLLLALPGLGLAVARPRDPRWRPEWMALAAASVLYLLFAMSLKIDAWGWSLGPRHLAPIVPFWVLATGSLVCSTQGWGLWSWRFMRVLVPYSVVVIVLPTLVFGGFPPDFSNPLADFIAPLISQGCVSPNVGSALGLSQFWGGAPLYLAVLAVLGWMAAKGSEPTWRKALAVLLAIALVAIALTVTGPEDPREQRSLAWVRNDILKCDSGTR